MKYDLNRLQSYDFEHLVQSICKRYIGAGCTSFGEGPDGGREATFQGSSAFPSEKENWTGYWVIQAKARTITIEAQGRDHKWLKLEIEKELKKYHSRKQSVTHPDNLIFFTNIILTSVAKTGGRDKISELCKELEAQYNIKHIHVISNHDIQDFLDLNRSLAISYAPFILPGDVLGKMLELLDNDKERHNYVHEAMCRFLETEFMEDIQTKLDQAGKLVTDKINLEKVFIDLDVVSERNRYFGFKFIEEIIKLGGTIQKWRSNEELNKFVLKAGPGQGKSTLTQFLAQAYRAYFLRELDENVYPSEYVLAFIDDYESLISERPKWVRIPFKIVLKDYAGWITETRKNDNTGSISIQNYLSRLIYKKIGMEVKSFELEILIRNISSLFIFDGLDEVPASSNRDIVLHELNLFTEMILRKMDADVIIVATTRPQGYSKEFDATKYNHLNIQDLTEENCKIYLKRLLQNTVDNVLAREAKMTILNRALEDPNVSRIMKSPLQASIMAILVNSGGEPPTNRYDLFKQYFTTILNREKQRGISEILQSDTASVTEIHYRLGVYLQAISEKSTNPSATIELAQFDEILNEYLLEKEFDSCKIELYTRDIQKAAIDRLVFISQLEDQRIGFAIRSLQEYFAASGYVDNIDDELVRERIFKISRNSYWSNTLIFITGYIAENKKYLTDYILSLCGQLNGEELNPGESNLTSIAKLGSWLALDILNEGIFRNNPKLENRFCKFLEPLFSLSPIDKHEDFGMLSDNIINKWVVDFLAKELEENPYNKTCLNIISSLYLKKKIEASKIIGLIPKNIELELAYILQILEHGDYNPVILGLFDQHFAEYPPHKLYELFSEEDNYEFLSVYLKIISADNIPRALELLLFGCFYSYHRSSNYTELFSFLGVKLTEWELEIPYFFQNDTEILNVEVVNGFSFEIKAYIPEENSILDKVMAFTEKEGTKLSKLLCDYIKCQTFDAYQRLIDEIDIQQPEYSVLLRSSLDSFDSLLHILANEKSLDEAFFSNAKKEILQIYWVAEPVTPERIIIYQKYGFDTGYGRGVQNHAIDFYRKFKNVDYNDVAKLFRAFMFYSIFKLTIEQLEQLKEDDDFMAFYRKVSSSTNYIEPYYSAYRILDVLFLLNVPEIMRFIKIQNLLVTPELEYVVFYDRKQLEPMLVKICLEKCIKVVQMQFITEEPVSYKYLFQSVIYYTNSFDSLIDISLPFADIADDDNVDKYGALLLLFDVNISKGALNKVKNFLKTNLEDLKDSDLPSALRFILRNMPYGPQKESILLMLNEVFTKNSYIKSLLLESTRHWVQNQPSLVEISGYNVY